MKRFLKTAALLGAAGLVLFAGGKPAAAQAVRDTSGFALSQLPRNDDSSTGLVNIGFNADFFGVNYSQLYVNNNGNVTFTGPLSTYTPFGITGGSTPMIAPFFADVDTRPLASGIVSYGQGTVGGHQAFAVNWPGVGYYNSHTNLLNDFQLMLIARPDTGTGNFDIEFNYNQIQWETGDASGGSNGLGGAAAHAGYTNGAGDFMELAGSGVNGAFLDSNANGLRYRSNAGTPGRIVFQAREGAVTAAVPEPTSALLFLPGLAALGLLRLRKKKREEPAEA